MGRSDLFRVGLSLCAVAFWVFAGIRMRESPLMKAKGLMICHVDRKCLESLPESASDNLMGLLSREMDCAVAIDSSWAMRIPCCDRSKLDLTMDETMFMIESLGMKSSYSLVDGVSGHFRVTLQHGTGQSAGRFLYFFFAQTEDRILLQDIHGLCELLTRLSLAAREQSSPREVEES